LLTRDRKMGKPYENEGGEIMKKFEELTDEWFNNEDIKEGLDEFIKNEVTNMIKEWQKDKKQCKNRECLAGHCAQIYWFCDFFGIKEADTL